MIENVFTITNSTSNLVRTLEFWQKSGYVEFI